MSGGTHRNAGASRSLYRFRLIVSGFDELTDELEGALLDAGCDDALVGIQAGVPYLEFDREGESFEQAVASALRDIESTGVGIKVLRVERETAGVPSGHDR